MLRALGHERIVAVDIEDAKLTAASAAGAAATVNSRDGEAQQKLQQITGGALYGAVDFVGSADTAQLGLASLRKGGKLILVGLFGGEIPLSVSRNSARPPIKGSHLGSVAR
jgi:Zn-dependent alcohol dehydrogenase